MYSGELDEPNVRSLSNPTTSLTILALYQEATKHVKLDVVLASCMLQWCRYVI
jgi:hypothetical protein